MSGTGRPMGTNSDPTRYDRIEELVSQGQPDSVIAKALMAEFGIGKSQAYAALRQFERETRELRNQDLADRRARVITELQALQAQARNVARVAIEGYDVVAGVDGEGQPRTAKTKDPKAAAMALSTCQQLYNRIIAVDGLSTETEAKVELLRLRLLEKSGLTPEQLEKLIAAEAGKALAAMPVEQVEALLAAKRGA